VNLKRNRKNAGLKPLARMKSHNKPHQLCQDPQDIFTRKRVTGVPRMKSEKQQEKSSHSVVLTGKRKRGTERSSKNRPSYKEPKSLPAYFQENVPSNEPKKAIHKMIEKDPSVVAKPKAGHERLINIDENIDEPSRTEREGMENFCGADDWTEEQDMALRKAYFTARPSPHFWKRVSKLVIPVLTSFGLAFFSSLVKCKTRPKNHYQTLICLAYIKDENAVVKVLVEYVFCNFQK